MNVEFNNIVITSHYNFTVILMIMIYFYSRFVITKKYLKKCKIKSKSTKIFSEENFIVKHLNS